MAWFLPLAPHQNHDRIGLFTDAEAAEDGFEEVVVVDVASDLAKLFHAVAEDQRGEHLARFGGLFEGSAGLCDGPNRLLGDVAMAFGDDGMGFGQGGEMEHFAESLLAMGETRPLQQGAGYAA